MRKFNVTLAKGPELGDVAPVWAKDLYAAVAALFDVGAHVIAISEVRTTQERSTPPATQFPFLVVLQGPAYQWAEIRYAQAATDFLQSSADCPKIVKISSIAFP